MEYVKKYWILIVAAFLLSAFFKPALCFLIFGMLVSYIALESMRFQKRLGSSGIRCTGRILSFERDRYGYKTPVIQFTPIGGNEIIQKPSIYSSTDLSKILSYDNLISTEVQVIYDPDDARKFALTEKLGGNSLAFLLFLLVGIVLTIVGVAALAGYIKLGN